MREIPKIIKELRDIEQQGQMSLGSDQVNGSQPERDNVDNEMPCNTMFFSEELQKLPDDSFGFQNLSMFLSACADFLELYPEPACITDKKGMITFVNHQFLSWVGFDKNELVGTLFFSSLFFSKRNEQSMIQYALDPNLQRFNNPYEMIFQTRNGDQQTGLLHMNVIKDLNDEMIGLIISITDITSFKVEQDEVTKLSQFQRSLIENENMWLSVCDLSSNVMMWNKAAERISGYSKDEVVGKNQVWTWLKPEKIGKDGFVTTKGFTRIEGTIVSEDFETCIKRKDGKIRVISWTPRMFLDQFNNPVGTITIGKDITDQKENEEKIKNQNKQLVELNKNLEEKVLERTEKIHSLLDQKNEFINQLGHDLKTPLTPLMALLPIIRKEIEKTEKKEMIDVMIRNANYMKDLITKTIEIAKLNSNMVPLTFIPVNVFDEVEFIKENNQMLFTEKHIIFENQVAHDVMVDADPLRFREILLNLVTNAVKYSKKDGGMVRIDARVDGSMEVISVVDDGIGMNAEQKKRVFDEFYKADESRHCLDSSGLGLNITKRLVEKHGGSIWVESDGIGKGSTFFFTLKRSDEIKSE
jgi:PAS domain S-box-containing protein